MLHLPTVKDNLATYIDAGFPILYIYTFEEAKADRYISSVAGKKKVIEWNGANGFVDFKTKSPLLENKSLEDTLSFLKTGNELQRHLLIIKDAAGQLQADKVIALLKEIARKIRKEDGGLDATIIIVSSTLHIPKELEKLTTVLELDLPDEKEIRTIIDTFVESNEITDVYPGLLDEMAVGFKGLTESEIQDLLCLAISQEGELTKKAIPHIMLDCFLDNFYIPEFVGIN